MSHRTVIYTEMPLRETLSACIQLALKVEYGTNTPIDDLTLLAHLRVLREDLDISTTTNAQRSSPEVGPSGGSSDG